ncbi:MAG TPA: 2-phospho-L-lactate transferase [Candidatus Dormibacteraeota bacterium]|nr:2-phospho-L-lactate transferase [Candidatus Dormibacteraeota bacterium]
MTRPPVVVLAGGVGAARFLRGLVQVVPAEEIVVIGNTGDDMWWRGLYIAPDLDTVTYWLAGLADTERGWGIREDTFTAQAALDALGADAWFQLGDRDIATHLYRTERLRQGAALSAVTAELASRQGVAARILPMTDQPVTTRLKTDLGDLHFQEYFVREATRPVVREIYWTGLESSTPGPGVLEAIRDARTILIAPSNPIISIGPILRVPGVREALVSAREKTVAVSPLIGGRAIKGPTVALMQAQGARPDALGVAELYRDIASGFVLDSVDGELSNSISGLGYRVATLSTMLDEVSEAIMVASAALEVISEAAA